MRTSGLGALFSYVDLEARVPQSHPLWVIRDLANEALAALAGEFSALYASTGRPSIPPEVYDFEPALANRWKILDQLRTGDERALPPCLRLAIERELHR